MKSIIIDGFHSFDVGQICDSAPFDKVFYIGAPDDFPQNTSKISIYDCFSIPLGKYPSDFIEAEPLDEKIINRFAECESIVMKMFERNDFWFQTSFDQRKEWYLLHLRYWYYIIYKYNVTCFIKSNFSHEVYDYIIYYILRDKNEKTYFFTQLSFMNRYILEEDIYSYPKLKKFVLENNEIKKPCKEVLDFLNKQRIPADLTKNVFQVIEKQRGGVKNQHKIIKNYNKKYAVIPDFAQKYFFVALHMQPEMTTCPLAGQFVYQDLIIELLDFYLPEDIFIYIKEHPAQTCIGRSENFYERFANRKRVKFIRTDVNSRILCDNSMAVVTCTGTIGWEALIRSKPVLMFGSFFYQFAPGCFCVKTREQLLSSIKTILSDYKIAQDEIDSFFQKVYEYSNYGYIDTAYKSLINISEKENENTILQIIQSKIYSNFLLEKEGNQC